MPLFEYECQDCGEKVELLIRGQETPVCPKCASLSLSRALSAPSVHTGGASRSLPMASGCDTSLPPCRPNCCRLPQ